MTAAEAMDRVVAAALLGARGEVGDVGAPARIAALGADRAGAQQALALAAGLSQYVRAGAVARVGGAERVAGPAPEQAKVAGRGSAAALRRALETTELLPECLRKLAERGVVAPAVMLPEMLERARRRAAERALIEPVLGARGRWLASLNAQWRALASAESLDAAAVAEVWQTGTRPERTAALEALRGHDRARARDLLESSWEQESPDDRSRFVIALQTGLGPEDEPLLERALADRRKPVRESAAAGLAKLPDSSYVARMIQRGTAAIRRAPGRKPRLEIELPAEDDAQLKREALPVPPRRELGERARLLEAIVTAVPPGAWVETLDMSPAELIAAAVKTDWASPVLHGWVAAARTHRHADWAESLVGADGKIESSVASADRAPLVAMLVEAGRNGPAAAAIDGATDAYWLAYIVSALRAPWPADITFAVARAAGRLLKKAKAAQLYRDDPIWLSLREAVLGADPGEVAGFRPILEAAAEKTPSIHEVFSLLDQREQMLEELTRDDRLDD